MYSSSIPIVFLLNTYLQNISNFVYLKYTTNFIFYLKLFSFSFFSLLFFIFVSIFYLFVYPLFTRCIAFINIILVFSYVFDLAAIITSKTRLSLLELFLKNDNLELGIRESARRIRANAMLVRNELIILEKSGLFKSRNVANSIQYSLNTDCEAIGPLRRLVSMK